MAVTKTKLAKCIHHRVRLRPPARRFRGVTELRIMDDDWLVQEVEDTQVRIRNIRTDHVALLPYTQISEYVTDPKREFAFYARLFGWTKDRAHDMGPMGTYQTFATGGTPCGGMMKGCAQMPGPCWNYYIAVDSVAAAAERTTTRGGQVLHGPVEVPGGDWIAQARDPQGAAFAMVSAKK